MATNEALARRWMASKHAQGWRRGMLDSWGQLCIEDGVAPSGPHDHGMGPVPDLGHPGTRAFLLEDVRRAWGRPDLSPIGRPPEHRQDNPWCFGGIDVPQKLWSYHQGEAEALIAALEAAPE